MCDHDFVWDRIRKALEAIEDEHSLKILYACESGSRAWGFESQDSDYDVRFIYVHPPDWYLSIDLEWKRDVLELPIDDHLDINGWDFRKALQLFRKSNPPLLEWLGSPIVYLEYSSLPHKLRDLLKFYHVPKACANHYLHMARGNFRDYLQGEEVWLKKYLYVLRPLLAVLWIEKGLGVVPTEFQKVVDATVEDTTLLKAIRNLLDQKKKGAELDRGPRVPTISEFIEENLNRLESSSFKFKPNPPPVELLNRLFREILDEVYQ